MALTMLQAIGWARVHLLHKERCACTSYTCPYTLGRGWHVTPNNPTVSREPWPPVSRA